MIPWHHKCHWFKSAAVIWYSKLCVMIETHCTCVCTWTNVHAIVKFVAGKKENVSFIYLINSNCWAKKLAQLFSIFSWSDMSSCDILFYKINCEMMNHVCFWCLEVCKNDTCLIAKYKEQGIKDTDENMIICLDKDWSCTHCRERTFWFNINGGDVQRKNVVTNVNKSSLWAPWQNGPYKNTQNITKHGVNKN